MKTILLLALLLFTGCSEMVGSETEIVTWYAFGHAYDVRVEDESGELIAVVPAYAYDMAITSVNVVYMSLNEDGASRRKFIVEDGLSYYVSAFKVDERE